MNSYSVNELLKIKDDLTKERDEKLSDIAKVRIFFFETFISCMFLFIVTFLNMIYLNLTVVLCNFVL